MKTQRILILVVLALAIAAVLCVKPRRTATPGVAGAPQAALPRLMDFGAGWCLPCRLMTPVMADLKAAYAGQLQVDYIDVNKDADAAKKYGVAVLPTQIFLDPAGRELYRHEGFFAKEDIVAKWKTLGYLEARGPEEEIQNAKCKMQN